MCIFTFIFSFVFICIRNIVRPKPSTFLLLEKHPKPLHTKPLHPYRTFKQSRIEILKPLC